MGIRVLRSFVILSVLVAAAACGGAASEARSARYAVEPDVLFETALQAADEDHDIAAVDPSVRGFRTVERWYEKDGTYEDTNADGDVIIGDGSIQLALIVRIKGEPGDWYVDIEPAGVQVLTGSPKGVPIRRDDPSLPGWVYSKIETLHVKIYERMKATIGPADGEAPTP